MQAIHDGSRVVAVIGTGSAGLRHLTALKRIGVVPVAIPKRHERQADLQQMGYATAATLADAIKSWTLSSCIIASDTSRHLADGFTALSSGLHTLVEKPLCVDGAEAKELRKRARAGEAGLWVACVMRFAQSLEIARSWLPTLGALASVRIECQSYLPDWRPARSYLESYSARREEGGVLRDVIHEIDYAGWLFGWPASLQARLHNSGKLGIEAEEAADLLWQTAAGAIVSMRLDYVTRPARRRMPVCGERGTLHWAAGRQSVRLELADGKTEERTADQSREEMFAAQAQAFLRCAAGDIDDRLATGQEGANALAVCDAARKADLSHHEEPVEYA
ncbi:MAG: Gfo/Idh/MocA family oxidoreductase [Nitrospiraceae bacterium]